MSFEVESTADFERKLKRLTKKYQSLKSEIRSLIESLPNNPRQGVLLANNCYKIRLAIASKEAYGSSCDLSESCMRMVSNTPMIPSRGYWHRIKRLVLKKGFLPLAERSIEGIPPLREVRRVLFTILKNLNALQV